MLMIQRLHTRSVMDIRMNVEPGANAQTSFWFHISLATVDIHTTHLIDILIAEINSACVSYWKALSLSMRLAGTLPAADGGVSALLNNITWCLQLNRQWMPGWFTTLIVHVYQDTRKSICVLFVRWIISATASKLDMRPPLTKQHCALLNNPLEVLTWWPYHVSR